MSWFHKIFFHGYQSLPYGCMGWLSGRFKDSESRNSRLRITCRRSPDRRDFFFCALLAVGSLVIFRFRDKSRLSTAMPAVGRNLPALMAVAVGLALRNGFQFHRLTVAMFYLRPYLIKQRDEQERQKLVEKMKQEETTQTSQQATETYSWPKQ
jgi:hypothetical protein